MTDWIRCRIDDTDCYLNVQNISDMRYNAYAHTMIIRMNNKDEITRTNVSADQFNDLKKELDCI